MRSQIEDLETKMREQTKPFEEEMEPIEAEIEAIASAADELHRLMLMINDSKC